MKLPLEITISILGALLVYSTSWAHMRVGAIGHGGDGCPQGSLVRMGQNLELSHFILKADAQRTLDRKACNLSIPVEVAPGTQAGILLPSVRVKGVLVSSRSELKLNAEAFISGSKGVKAESQLVGPRRGTREIKLGKSQVAWGACGQSVILRLKLSAQLLNPSGRQSRIVLDRISGGAKNLILTRPCN